MYGHMNLIYLVSESMCTLKKNWNFVFIAFILHELELGPQ